MLPKRVKFNEDIGDTCTPHNQRTFTLSTTVASWTHSPHRQLATPTVAIAVMTPVGPMSSPHVLADTLVEALEI